MLARGLALGWPFVRFVGPSITGIDRSVLWRNILYWEPLEGVGRLWIWGYHPSNCHIEPPLYSLVCWIFIHSHSVGGIDLSVCGDKRCMCVCMLFCNSDSKIVESKVYRIWYTWLRYAPGLWLVLGRAGHTTRECLECLSMFILPRWRHNVLLTLWILLCTIKLKLN